VLNFENILHQAIKKVIEKKNEEKKTKKKIFLYKAAGLALCTVCFSSPRCLTLSTYQA
jgi:ornithine cyclodeaminase/alanine dehydrogenase-like protein (mu-crystallin family)